MKSLLQKVLATALWVVALAIPSAFGQTFVPGQVLTADSLNSAFSKYLPAAGGTVTGPVSSSSLWSISNIYYVSPRPGASPTNVQFKLQQIISSDEFAAWGAQNIQVGDGGFPNSGFVGSGNVNFGFNNLRLLTSGYANKSFGNNNLQGVTTGYFNYAFGDQVLQTVSTGYLNNGFGSYTLGYLTTGFGNSAFGDDNQRYETTASLNSSGGSQALYNNVTGNNNTAFGAYAARGTANPPDAGPGTGPSPASISAFGSQALYTAGGSYNTAGGYSAGYSTTGSFNSYWGANAGYSITSGANDVFIGYNAGNNAGQLATASGVTVVGQGAYSAGSNTVVVGIAAAATGGNAVVLGQSNVGAQNDIVIGAGSTATGTGTTIIGNGLSTASNNVTLIGASTNTSVFFYGGLQPQLDNTFAIGASGARWTTVYATTGTINTSDAREKQQIRPITSKVLKAWANVHFVEFKWNSDVHRAGGGAKTQFGVIAQNIVESFRREGLDALNYGLVTLEPDEQGQDRYGVRYDEVMVIEAAYERAKLDELSYLLQQQASRRHVQRRSHVHCAGDAHVVQ